MVNRIESREPREHPGDSPGVKNRYSTASMRRELTNEPDLTMERESIEPSHLAMIYTIRSADHGLCFGTVSIIHCIRSLDNNSIIEMFILRALTFPEFSGCHFFSWLWLA